MKLLSCYDNPGRIRSCFTDPLGRIRAQACPPTDCCAGWTVTQASCGPSCGGEGAAFSQLICTLAPRSLQYVRLAGALPRPTYDNSGMDCGGTDSSLSVQLSTLADPLVNDARMKIVDFCFQRSGALWPACGSYPFTGWMAVMNEHNGPRPLWFHATRWYAGIGPAAYGHGGFTISAAQCLSLAQIPFLVDIPPGGLLTPNGAPGALGVTARWPPAPGNCDELHPYVAIPCDSGPTGLQRYYGSEVPILRFSVPQQVSLVRIHLVGSLTTHRIGLDNGLPETVGYPGFSVRSVDELITYDPFPPVPQNPPTTECSLISVDFDSTFETQLPQGEYVLAAHFPQYSYWHPSGTAIYLTPRLSAQLVRDLIEVTIL
ncbi:MAG TPA: hypothetical protein PKC49_05415 [Phycisphaerae bacterium]|nr:hypothetical protein [Phycisphaerae bacterium]